MESIEIKVEQRMGNKKVFNRGIDIADMKWFLLAKDSSDTSQKYLANKHFEQRAQNPAYKLMMFKSGVLSQRDSQSSFTR